MIVDGIKVKRHPVFTNYAVSECGKVYSVPRRDKMNHRLGGWMKPSPDNHGYLFVNLCLNGKRNMRRVCRLVLETYVGFRPRKMECRHLDGRKQNDLLKNLKWGTRRENQLDRKRHGTGNNLERNPHAKLTQQNVKEIRNKYVPRKYSQCVLAKEYGVTRTAIQAIIENRTWIGV